MIKSYDETWKFYIRLKELTARRGDYKPYYINSTLYDFLKSTNNNPTLDIGCGENNLQLFFPNIHGMDKTIEADTFSFITDTEFLELPEYEYGVAVNSLHWEDIHANIELALSKCKRMWISLNENQPIDDFKKIETWEKYGTVEYFWHGQNPATKDVIKCHLNDDHLYHHLAKLNNRTLEHDVEMIYNDTVYRDPFFGVVRIIISRH
jgi:hypothetical protein